MIQRNDQVATRQVEERCIDRRIHTSTSRHCHDLGSERKDWHEGLQPKALKRQSSSISRLSSWIAFRSLRMLARVTLLQMAHI